MQGLNAVLMLIVWSLWTMPSAWAKAAHASSSAHTAT